MSWACVSKIPRFAAALILLILTVILVQVADALNIHASMVSNVVVWGNATSSSVLDILHGSVRGERGYVSLQNCVDEELVQIISQAVRERTALIVQVSPLICKFLRCRKADQPDCCAGVPFLMLAVQPNSSHEDDSMQGSRLRMRTAGCMSILPSK